MANQQKEEWYNDILYLYKFMRKDFASDYGRNKKQEFLNFFQAKKFNIMNKPKLQDNFKMIYATKIDSK